MNRPFKTEAWMLDAANLMAMTGCSLKQAATDLDLDVTSEECNNIIRREGFQKLLQEARHKHFHDLGSDPNYSKDSAVGKLIVLSQKLEEEGSFDKAAEVVLKIAKIQGWVGPESNVSVFGELTQRDLDAIREQVVKETKVQ